MSKKILVLEDDPDLLASFGSVISLLGHEMLAATSVADLRMHGDGVLGLDLALLDLHLGDDAETGVDAAVWLKQTGYRGRLVFMTGHTRSHPLVARANQMERASVLHKPIRVQMLTALFESGDA